MVVVVGLLSAVVVVSIGFLHKWIKYKPISYSSCYRAYGGVLGEGRMLGGVGRELGGSGVLGEVDWELGGSGVLSGVDWELGGSGVLGGVDWELGRSGVLGGVGRELGGGWGQWGVVGYK